MLSRYMFSSSNWLGHYSFTVATRVQVPLGISVITLLRRQIKLCFFRFTFLF